MVSVSTISGKTRVLCVIGDPIEHTMSPAMHNAAIEALGLDLVYVAFHVLPEKLESAINGFKALDVLGINVTIPHKINVMQYLDDIDPVARGIGAVNTIKNVDGEFLGRNTDADGSIQALNAAGIDVKGALVSLLGAGGGARAVGFALAREGASIDILVRKEDVEAGAEIVSDIQALFPSCSVESMLLDEAAIENVIPASSVVINATPIGMYPNEGESLLEASCLHPGMGVLDLVYNPLETMLLRHAREVGCNVVPGIDMLVNQGAMAFEWWTSEKPPMDVMKQAAISILDSR
ncbi:MAG TPA: shikimate dehydrogenase [Candidatus Lokiarchaeia archaeon]|nr:shikimate dehydrogenase [Candidatus Lokiarchaeia archaeon]